MGNIASRFLWIFGTAALPTDGTGPPNNVLGSTGAGVAFNTLGWGEAFSFYVETDAGATCSYQIRTARKAAGPWAVVSSGTLTSNAVDIVQIQGPFAWLSPRVKTMTSTSVQVAIRMTAVEA